MKYMLALVLSVFMCGSAIAQHAHGAKGPNGGELQDVAGVVAELVTAGNSVTIYIADEGNKPVAVKGYTASILVASGGGQETATLEQAGDNSFKGSTKAAIAPGATITVMLKTAAGKTGQVRFKK
jgi:nitrogen fixation protein FixH